MNNQVVTYNLQSLRIRNGWSQSFVCKLTGISQRTLSRIENGASASKNTIKKLCNLYKIDMESLYESEKQVKPLLHKLCLSLPTFLCRSKPGQQD